MNRRQFVLGSVGATSVIWSAQRGYTEPCPPPLLQLDQSTGVQTACEGFPQSLPYSLPNAGEAVAIGVNYADDVRPQTHTMTQWAYSLFNSYGSGAYVADYSAGGAYVLAGTGGHGHPPNVDACLFDFATARWERLANANGVATRATDYGDGEMTGSPYWEVTGTQVPAPPHPYRNAVGISAAFGGGSKGSVVYLGRAAAGSGAHSSTGVHRFDLATRTWSRWGNGTLAAMEVESDAVVDETTGRVFSLRNQIHYHTSLQHFSPQTAGINSSAISAPPYLGSGYPSAFIHPTFRLLFHHRADTLQAINIDNPTSFSRITNISGSLPTASSNAFCYYPPTGNFYWLPATGGSILARLVPPASNPLSNQWSIDTTSVSVVGGGGTMPAYGDQRGQAHYRSLFYVSKLQCLAWVPGSSMSGIQNKVYLIKPVR